MEELSFLRKGSSYIDYNNNVNDTEYAIDYFTDCGYTRYTPNFLNDKKTKEKLGVNESIKHSICANLNYKWGDAIYFYKNDIKELSKEKNFTSWLYSGTEDMICTPLQTMRTLNELNYTIKEKWKKWIIDNQVVGMEQTYDYGLKFITVKNAGHMVVEDQPKIAKALLDKFIEINKEKEDNKNNDNKDDKSFPVWAIVVISVGCFLIVLIFALIIHKKCRSKSSDIDFEEKGKLVNPITDDD